MTVQVKICGVTRPEDADRAAELGAAMVGVNLWPGSPRCVDLARAREVADAVRGRSTVVGVFVDQPPGFVAEARERAGLDLVQLHGAEGPDEVAVHGAAAIKVFRVGAELDRAALEAYRDAWGFLFDTLHPRLHGGTGEGWRWELVYGVAPGRRVLVAGGVRPGTAREAIARCRPWGIDVCSGVERAPGVKDPDLLERLFEEIVDEQTVLPA